MIWLIWLKEISPQTGEFIAQQLYPGVNRDDLTEDQRQTISALSTLAAGLAGGVAGDSTANAVAGAQAGKNAVENNHLSQPQQQSRSEELSACNGNSSCRSEVRQKYAAEYDKVQKEIASCASPEQCISLARELKGWQGDYSTRMNELETKVRDKGMESLTGAEVQEWANLRGAMSNIDASRDLLVHRAQILGGSEDTSKEIVNILGQTGIASAAGVAGGISKVGSNSSGARDNRLPVPEATVAKNGLKIESNPKHTPGAAGSRPNAGVEPKNSLDLFENSIATKDPKVRLSIDSDGNIHRFFNTNKDGSGTYHWSGSTGDGKNGLGNRELGSFNKEIKELKGKK